MRSRALEEIVDNFRLLDDWEDRYAYLIDLGGALPEMGEALKNDENRVRGCTSRVWLAVSKDEEGRCHFLADSDARIVRGLLAVLLAACEGRTAEEIKSADINGAFCEMGLDQHLSPNRRSGFFAVAGNIRAMAGVRSAE